MSALVCSHPRGPRPDRMCRHLADDEDVSYVIRFTGGGVDHVLVCADCRDAPLESLVEVCGECFRERQWSVFYMDGFTGAPEVLSRPTSLHLEHRDVAVPALARFSLRAVAPCPDPARSLWLAVTDRGDLARIDLDARIVDPVVSLPGAAVPLDQEMGVVPSPCGRFAAVVSTKGRYGVVVDLTSGAVTMTLDRGNYHEDVQEYSVAFFLDGDRTLLVHATEWNRLDISDPATGALLTPRDTTWHQGQPEPPHYLDYFHAGLTASADGRWLVDDGWVWHPVGVLRALDLRRWAHENVWESEDGPSVVTLRQAAYFWDAPRCFVADGILAVGGFGSDDEHMLDAALLFDVRTGELTRWFAGPPCRGRFVFDELLFCTAKERGTSAWDVATGERVFHDPAFSPAAYHPGLRRFLTPGEGGVLRTSALAGGR